MTGTARATETEAQAACSELREIIEAAENSNQAGEDAAVAAADAPRLRSAIVRYAKKMTLVSCSGMADDLLAILGEEHYHVGPDEICQLCRQDLRDSSHMRGGTK